MKDFKSYNCQMRELRNNKGIGCNGSTDKQTLIRHGYFNLINGYKEPFKQGHDQVTGKTIYIGQTHLSHFLAVKDFDSNLRLHMLKYLTQVEEEVRTVVGYKFDCLNNNGSTKWYEVESYNPSLSVQDRMRVISMCFTEIEKSKYSPYVEHYLKNHSEIPTWILLKAINLKPFITFLSKCKPNVLDSVCDLYNVVDDKGKNDYNMLQTMLHWIRKVRNSCAHNERTFGIRKENNRTYTPFKKYLPNRKRYNEQRSQRLIDLIVYFRYFLPDLEYDDFVEGIAILLDNLKKNINTNSFDMVRSSLGILSLDDLTTLKTTTKKIDYNQF